MTHEDYVSLIDSALISHVANEAQLLQSLSREEQHTLAVLLCKWLSSLERHAEMERNQALTPQKHSE